MGPKKQPEKDKDSDIIDQDESSESLLSEIELLKQKLKIAEQENETLGVRLRRRRICSTAR